jgi:hypothetical protein
MPIAEFGQRASAQANAIFSALSEDGAVIIRQALPDEVVTYLQLLSTAAFAIMDIKAKELEQGRSNRHDHLRSYVEIYRSLQFIGEDVVITVLSHAGLTDSGFSPVVDALLKYLGPMFPYPLSFVPSKSALRRQGSRDHAKKTAYVPWHRDAHAVQLLEFGNVFNCWAPCEPVGFNRASLQIVRGSSKIMKQRSVDYATQEYHGDDQVRSEFGQESICTAVLDPGDILIFNHHTLHRTQPMSDDALTRMSGEFRFTNGQ